MVMLPLRPVAVEPVLLKKKLVTTGTGGWPDNRYGLLPPKGPMSCPLLPAPVAGEAGVSVRSLKFLSRIVNGDEPG